MNPREATSAPARRSFQDRREPERRIRVLYLQPSTHFGGAERQAATILPLLPELGVDAVPYVGPGDEITSWLEERGVIDHVLSANFPGAWQKPRGLARLGLPWRYARCVRACRAEIARLIHDRGIDLVFAAMGFSWIAATPVARKAGIPIVWRVGGTECSGVERGFLAVWSKLNRPDHLVCNGDTVRALFEPLIGAPATTIRNGLDPRQFHPSAGRPSLLRPPGAKTVIGFAARLVPQKRPEDFIAAAARLAHRDDLAFLFAGEGSRRASYVELARRTGATTLHDVGYIADMRDFYAACDVLVLPSRSEGCPNVVLEAMAMGTAVVCADVPAVREIVTTGFDGMLYPLGNITALVSTLELLLRDPGRRDLVVARARRRVAELTAMECASRTAALLRRVEASSRVRSLPPSSEPMALQA